MSARETYAAVRLGHPESCSIRAGIGSFIAGGAHGAGRGYAHGVPIGTIAVTQLSVGFQAGGEAYSEIILFKDQEALNAFESGNFQSGAGVSAVLITVGASVAGEKFTYHAKS